MVGSAADWKQAVNALASKPYQQLSAETKLDLLWILIEIFSATDLFKECMDETMQQQVEAQFKVGSTKSKTTIQ